MKKLILLLICFCVIKANGQDHLISFAGTGASTVVSSVKIENLTSGISLMVNGNDILHLIGIKTGLKSIENDISSGIKIYPNPMTDNSIIEIFPRVKGNAVISLLDITGKPVARIHSYMEKSRQDFKLSGIKTGFYLINVEGDDYQYSGKLFSNGKSAGKVRIEKVNNNILLDDEKYAKTESKGIQTTVDMAYSSGDVLKFTAISDIYSTIKTDSPTQDKTIIFNFIPCTDADNVNYPIVEIGTQVWMAENLGTTKYSNSTAIPLVTGNTEWAALSTPGYCWYNNDESNYRAVYGALYNWHVLNVSSNGGRNVCPVGWHVPADTEWSVLTTFLGGESVAGIKLRETGLTHWLSPNSGTNESGFTAVSVGDRSSVGAFHIPGDDGTWWTSTSNNINNAWFRSISHDLSNVTRNYYNKLNGFSVRCIKGDFKTLPVLTTSSTDSITLTTAISGGNITSDGEDEIINRGVCWGISPNPTIDSSKTSNGNESGAFTSNLSGLSPGVQYFARAYATNSAGTAYGNQMSFNTKINDVEGNTYNTVTIGNQLWMAENLKTIKLNNNNTILNVTGRVEWSQLLIPAYCWFGDDSTQKDISGALYNWHTINTGKLCPIDWHVPTDAEWSILISYLGGESIAGDKLRETSSVYLQDSTIITYESGFSALPGGYRDHGPLSPG